MNNFEDSSSGVGVGSIIGNKFRLEEKLGQGSFGMIFKCINLENQETFAMKMEKRNQRHSSMLVREIKVMMELKNEFGYARMITYGKDDDYNYVVMTNLGKNLDSILKKCNQRFSLATCMNIMDQMITRLEVLHNHNLIHRDIKPENFVIGPDRGFNQIYLIDFGLAKYYKDSEGNHIPMVEKKGMIGTARYASINAHQGLEQSRRDDLEALGYVLLYFIRGKLPWQQIYAETKDEKYEKIKNMKMNTPLEQLCEGCPNELVQYLRIVKKLDFTEQPNYTQLKGLFKKVITDRKLETQSQNVDWENLADYRHRKKFPITQELAQIPSQKEIALRQQQLRQQQLLQQQQQMQLQLQSKEYLPQNSAGGVGAAGVGEQADNKKHPKSSTQNNIQNGQQNEKQGGVSASKNKGAKENIVTSNLPNQDVTNNNKNYHHTIQNSNNNNNQNNNVTTNNTNNKDNQQQQNKSNNNNAQNQQAAAQIIDSQKQNQPQQQATNNNISISPPGGAQKTTSILNAVQSPETGKFGGESRTNAINDSGLALQNNERISKNGGSTLVNILGQSGQNNTNSNNPNNQNNQLNNREVSVSILNNHPNFQLNSSQNNSINGIQQTNNSPVNNPNSSSLIGNGIMEKRNSFLHALNQIHGNSNHNLLNVPTKDQVSVSYTSIAGTSKLNNYSGSDSDTIVDEGGINISTMMMINRNASPMSTSDIRRDIRTRSLVIRQSQLEIGELDLNRIQDHNSNHFKHTNNSVNHAQTNGVYKSDFNHGGIDSHRQNHHDSTHNIDNTSSPKKTNKSGKQNSHTNNNQQENIINGKMSASAVNGKANSSSQNNGYAAYRQYASAEEIKEHQDEENNSNTRNIKNYKTQFTPITEVKESTYKSLKTKTSKASFFGENITESMYEHPIMINIMPIKKAFLKKN